MTNPNSLLRQAVAVQKQKPVTTPHRTPDAGGLNDLLRNALAANSTSSTLAEAFSRALTEKES